MDSVRLGRVLGIGTRVAARTAAKTLAGAVDAASAPNPSTSPGPTAASTSQQATSRARPVVVAARTAAEVRNGSRGLARGSRRFGEAVWGPVTRLSGVLWLEFTGFFFGLFAFSAAVGAWRLRADLHPSSAAAPGSANHFWIAVGIAVLFGYFCLTSFVRANRRSNR